MRKTKQIHIIAYKGKSFFSKLIRWKTSSEYSHVEAVNNYEVNGFDTYGAINLKGVMWCKIDWHTKGTHYDVYSIDVTEDEFINFWKFLMSQRSKKYDIRGIFGYVTYKPLNDKNKWYCSEILYSALKIIGIELFNKDLKFPSPDLLVLSKELKLVRSGVVGEEPKENKDLDNILKDIKEQDKVETTGFLVQEDIKENGITKTN